MWHGCCKLADFLLSWMPISCCVSSTLFASFCRLCFFSVIWFVNSCCLSSCSEASLAGLEFRLDGRQKPFCGRGTKCPVSERLGQVCLLLESKTWYLGYFGELRECRDCFQDEGITLEDSRRGFAALLRLLSWFADLTIHHSDSHKLPLANWICPMGVGKRQ